VAGSTLLLSPRRDKLAWAKIAAFTTVNPHATAETAQIHFQTHMQLHIIQQKYILHSYKLTTTKDTQKQL